MGYKTFTERNQGEVVSEWDFLQGTVISVQTLPLITVKKEHFTEGKLFYNPQNQFLKLNLRS